MREKIKDKGRLEHILNSIDVLLCNKGKYEYADVEKDPIVFFGFVKHVEIIGEAVYMLTKEFRATHPEVDWDVIEGMRHVLVHGYYKIRPKQLWNTIENDIPRLKPVFVFASFFISTTYILKGRKVKSKNLQLIIKSKN